jgi:predicted DNA-binding transcriptional regulator AlpA
MARKPPRKLSDMSQEEIDESSRHKVQRQQERMQERKDKEYKLQVARMQELLQKVIDHKYHILDLLENSFPEKLDSGHLAEALGVNRRTIYRWRLVGYLPKPCALIHEVVWFKEDIEAWVRSDYKWANELLKHHAKKRLEQDGRDFGEFIAPSFTLETPAVMASIDQLEMEMNSKRAFVDEPQWRKPAEQE